MKTCERIEFKLFYRRLFLCIVNMFFNTDQFKNVLNIDFIVGMCGMFLFLEIVTTYF